MIVNDDFVPKIPVLEIQSEFLEAAPSAFIGASNFFELAVAVAIIPFGVHSG